MISRFAHIRHPVQSLLARTEREKFIREIAKRTDLFERWTFGRNSDATLEQVVQPDAVLDIVAQHFPHNSVSMVLLGPVGVGKTYVQKALIREHIFFGDTLNFVSGPALAQTSLNDLVNPRYLFIDDLGVERDTPTGDERMFQIIDGRWDRYKTTMITSNLDPEAFIARVGDRVYDRIDGPTVVLTGVSRRRVPIDEVASFVLDDGRGFNEDGLEYLHARVAELPDDEWRRWCSLLIAEGLYEFVVPDHDFASEWQAPAIVGCVEEVFGHDLDEWLIYAEAAESVD
jgi:hypothetical protein